MTFIGKYFTVPLSRQEWNSPVIVDTTVDGLESVHSTETGPSRSIRSVRVLVLLPHGTPSGPVNGEGRPAGVGGRVTGVRVSTPETGREVQTLLDLE